MAGFEVLMSLLLVGGYLRSDFMSESEVWTWTNDGNFAHVLR